MKGYVLKFLPVKAAPVVLLTGLILSGFRCSDTPQISRTIRSDPSSYFYIDTDNYPANRSALPIGIFDSGTGGLTVMDAIVNYDGFDNIRGEALNGGDGLADFQNEFFIYLGDQANMPYGSYAAENNVELLEEHILKDVQFLLGRKYYRYAGDDVCQTDKQPVKSIVIACNTATAFGKDMIEEFLDEAGLDIHVIGVIGAGVRGAFEHIAPQENVTIAVMATAGTVASEGYLKMIQQHAESGEYRGQITAVQQAGIGLAGAIDGSPEYIFPDAETPYVDYRGPSIHNKSAMLDTTIFDRYNFDWSGILYSGDRKQPRDIQLNSVENYIRYHVVSLLESVRKSDSPNPLKVIILGCTHYPFYTAQIQNQLRRLYDYQENGQFVYRYVMAKKIILIDPAVNTAHELFDHLKDANLLNHSLMTNSEFYISRPNRTNPDIRMDDLGRFTYEYKYGRRAGEIQEYVKRIPFSRLSLDDEVIKRLSSDVPRVFHLIQEFNRFNPKMNYLDSNDKLSMD